MNRRLLAGLLAAAFVAAGCSGRSTVPSTSGGGADHAAFRGARGPAAGKIQHVIIVVQENRSFDNLFYGYKGADTATQGQNSKGQTVTLRPVSMTQTYDLGHYSADYFAACDGTGSIPGTNCRMDGFDLESVDGTTKPNPEYAYVPHKETKLYFQMARQYVLADRMFTSHIDASFVSHQYIIAGQAQQAVDVPTLAWGCNGGKTDTVATLRRDRSYGHSESPCFDYTTLGDELDAAALPWRFYADPLGQAGSLWSAYQAVNHIRNGPDWSADVISPSTQFLTDVQNGQLAAVTWITPSFANSDHGHSTTGPDWVASIVNAVGESQFWDTSAIFVMWDEWGGWYDHVQPPYLDFDGAGFRVPLLVISPYAKKNFVSHVQYEHGSLLKYAESAFGLASLAASDARANALDDDCFDYNRKPRTFKPFATQLKAADFERGAASSQPPDGE